MSSFLHDDLLEQEIYLDFNATTPLDPRAFEAMRPYFEEFHASPMSHHAAGRRVMQAVEEAREHVARLIHAPDPDTIIFTSGGTESNNAAIFGAIAGLAPDASRRALVTSVVEHAAVRKPLLSICEASGYELRLLDVDEHCHVRASHIEQAIDEEVAFVSLMHANNEVGSVQPVCAVGQRCREVGAIFHVDGAQAVGKLDVDVQRDQIDLYTIVGHKFHGPKGIGALYLGKDVPWRSSLLGAGHERGRRAGTHHVPGIIGLGVACKIALEERVANQRRLRELREILWHELSSRIPQIHRTYQGDEHQCLAHTLHICFPGMLGAQVLDAARIVLASTGAACHRPDDPPSSTLLAMGLDPELARGSVRLSLGHHTSPEQLVRAAQALASAHERLEEQV